MDNDNYLHDLASYLQKIKNIEKIEFLPFHHLGFSKYEELKIENPLKDVAEMDTKECEELQEKFMNIYHGISNQN